MYIVNQFESIWNRFKMNSNKAETIFVSAGKMISPVDRATKTSLIYPLFFENTKSIIGWFYILFAILEKLMK